MAVIPRRRGFQSSRMLTTVQPRRLGGVEDRLGVRVGHRRARVGVLALGVVVVDDQAQRRPLAGVRVLEHLAVAGAVAGGEDRPAADVGLDVDRLRRALVGRAEHRRLAHEHDAPVAALELDLHGGADDVVGRDAVELVADRADELDAAARDDEHAEAVRAQQVHQLEHRRVRQLAERHAEARVLGRGEPVRGVARELLGGAARVELEQHAGDRLHAELAARPRGRRRAAP